MNFALSVVLSFSIAIPAIIGLIRFNKINKVYYPFIFCMWLGLLNEIVSYIIVTRHYSNTINSNIYMLLEAILLVLLFRGLQTFNAKNRLLLGIIVGLAVIWIIENFIISKITAFDSYFRIVYSSVITIMSINMMNHLIVTERKALLTNSVFILCTAFILYYTLNILSEAFWIYGINENSAFRERIYIISVVTNFIAIILYTLSIIWMPTKLRFTLPSF